MLRWTFAITVLVTNALFAVLALSASAAVLPTDFVIDDFDDAVPTTAPTSNFEFVRTASVAPSGANRAVRLVGLQANPEGFWDIGQSVDSHLTARIDRLNGGSQPVVALALTYEWSEGITIDASNDALLIDVSQLSAASALPQLRVSVRDSVSMSSYGFRRNVFPLAPDGGTLVFPFSEFRVERGPGRPDFDFTTVRDVGIFVSVALFEGLEEPDFTIEIDRIQFGRIIPEPGGSALASLVLTGVYSKRMRRRLLLGESTI